MGSSRSTVTRSLGLAVACVLLGTSVARADDVYTVHTCRGPSGEPAAPDGWVPRDSGVERRDDCLAGGDIAAGPTQVPFTFPRGFGWTFVAPPDTRIVAWNLYRTVRLSREANGAWGWNWNLMRDELIVDPAHVVEHCYQFEGCLALGDGRVSDASKVGESGVDQRAVFAYIDCNPNTCPPWTLASMTIHRAEFTLRDKSDPSFVGTPSGDLLDTTRPLAGVRTVSFSATDKGGGVYQASVEIDGQLAVTKIVDDNGGRCVEPFTAAVPCKETASGSLSLDTASLPDGPHSIRVIVNDPTGTNTAAFGPIQITTQNGSPECNPAIRSNVTPVAVAFHGTRQAAVTHRSGKATIHGKIANVGAGTLVHLVTRERRNGAHVQFAGTAITEADGSFTIAVPAGPSRRVRAAYRQSPTEPFLACSRALTLRVPARARLSAAPRRVRPGHRVRLTGALLGGSVPRGGKIVDFQARSSGSWRTFDTARSDSRGRFRTSYRFNRRAVSATYPIRVRVRPDASYPFDLGYSKPVRVRVR